MWDGENRAMEVKEIATGWLGNAASKVEWGNAKGLIIARKLNMAE